MRDHLTLVAKAGSDAAIAGTVLPNWCSLKAGVKLHFPRVKSVPLSTRDNFQHFLTFQALFNVQHQRVKFFARYSMETRVQGTQSTTRAFHTTQHYLIVIVINTHIEHQTGPPTLWYSSVCGPFRITDPRRDHSVWPVSCASATGLNGQERPRALM